jgi:hypothetical protein
MTAPFSFKSREAVLRHFLRKYPLGTAFDVIAAGERCEKRIASLALTIPAANHAGSRHYVRSDGTAGSMAVDMEWRVELRFDDHLALQGIEAELIPVRKSRDPGA